MIKIKQLAEVIQKMIGHEGQLKWNTEKLDNTLQKLIDISRLSEISWYSRLTLEEKFTRTNQNFKAEF